MGDVGGISNSGNRFTGLATGMDTDAMVKKMLMREQARIDRVQGQKQYNQWKQEEYVDVIKDCRDLRDKFLFIGAPEETNLMKSTAYATTKAKSENEGIVDTTSMPGAKSGRYMMKVVRMAKSASIEFKVDSGKGKTGKEVIEEMKKAKSDLFNKTDINYSELTGSITINSKETGEKSTLDVSGIQSIIDKYKLGSEKVEQGQDSVVYIKEPGQKEYTMFKNEKNSFIVDNVKYDITTTSVSDIVVQQFEKAKTDVDLKALDTNSIKNGDAGATGINVKKDVSSSVEKIKKFVDKYNELIEKLNSKVDEKKSYKYKPLTEEQKKDMKEEEIKEWNKQAKQGILKNDMDLEQMLSQMRQSFFKEHDHEKFGLSLSEIGISTTKDFSKRGKLEIDEAKLTKSLEENGDKVHDLFTKSGSKTEDKGIFNRINDVLDRYAGGHGQDGVLVKKSGYIGSRWMLNNNLSKKMVEQEKQIKQLERRMFEKQEQYYKMFSQLEVAMNKMNAQANWFSSQMGQ